MGGGTSHGEAWRGATWHGEARRAGAWQGLLREQKEISMFEQLNVSIVGIAPLLMHNGRLCDPMNPFTKALKSLTGKRKKTDEDQIAIAMAEWRGGLYTDAENRVVIPGENLESMFVDGAKKSKRGTQAKSGIFCDGSWPLIYDGPKDVDKLAADPKFRDTRGVGVQQSRVMRTRPIFRNWKLDFVMSYDPAQFNQSDISEILTTAGANVGLCDYTPKFGRFMLAK
jgi:hypothetical protein